MAKFNIKTVKPKFVVATTPETKIDVSINRPIITAKNQKAYFKLKNTGGPKGDKGDTGDAATITVGSTSTGTPGTNASVTNSGTSSAAVLNFTIPRGDKGDKGDTGATGNPGAAATISVGTTTTGQPGTNASVTNVGTSSAAVLNFTIPKGAKGDTGATGAPGATGSPGAAATVAVGTTTTSAAGTSASVTNSGTQSAAVLNFTIPKGDKGDNGNPGSAATIAVGTVTTLQPNQSAYVTNVGTSSAAVFDIGIPKGEQGQAGSGSGDMLAADYDPNGTVQNAGGIVAYVASEVPTKTSELLNDGSDGMAAYLETDETAYRTASIPYGECDNTSTSTAFTATVPGITALRDGVCVWLKNGVVTSTTGFTININGLGAKPSYSNMAAATQDSTIFNVNYTMLFVYDSTRVAGGCWVCYRGYNSDTNTIGYQLRTNSTALTVTDRTRYYRLLFTSADNTQWVPANTQYDNSATSNKTVNQRKINPFGRIVYMTGTTNVPAGSAVGATTTWDQYTLNLGYSFAKGSALTMTFPKPVYIKCAPQTDGSAIIDSTTPYVQDLPTTDDGKIYIFLGMAYSATNIELVIDHPVYYYKDGSIRLWTNAQALATVATSGSYNDLTDKPTIPAAQVNSDWNAVSGVEQILNKPSLATVATSGNYSDLSGTPTIPTVNDATLTIQKNGSTVETFTANASSSVTANITVPTQTSELTNNSGYVADNGVLAAGTGSSLSLTLSKSSSFTKLVLGGNATQASTPAPSSPASVLTATGSQTISIVNGGSQSFTINLGSIEIAKVGSSQDYIYFMGGNWYVHKETSSVVLTGAETGWSYNSTYKVFWIRNYDAGMTGYDYSATGYSDKISNRFVYHALSGNNASLADGLYENSTQAGLSMLLFHHAASTSLSSWQTWLGSNNTTVYYVLAQPYDEMITDSSLVGQLNALLTATLSSGTNSVSVSATTGHAPVLLDVALYPSDLPVATSGALGAVSVGSGLAITASGMLTADAGAILASRRTTLYENSQGTKASFAVSSAFSNFNAIEITYRDGNDNYAIRTIPGIATNFVLDISHPGASSTVYWYISRYIVSGTTITVGANNTRKAISNSITSTTTQDIYVLKVVGIKY